MMFGILTIILILSTISEDDTDNRNKIGYILIGITGLLNVITLITIIIGKVRDCILKRRIKKAQ